MLLRHKALVVALSLALSSFSAWAQCSGQPAAGLLCGNPNAAIGFPTWANATTFLDRNFGAPSVQGTILNRGASLWSATSAPFLGLNGTAGGSITLNGATSGSSAISVNAVAGTSTFRLPVGNGSPNQVLITDGSGNTSWTNAGAGTVSSVALALPGIFTVSGSPIVGSGTLTGTLVTQSANLVWAGPTTGAASAPTFRSLVGADLPNPSASALGGIQSFAAVGSQWIRQISTSGVVTASQPAFTDISGVATGAQLPNPSASTLGGIQSLAAATSKWINTISTAGVPSATQPQFSDIAGSAVLGQLPSIGNNSILANNSGGTAVPAALTTSNILDFIATTQGDILYRNATTWVPLVPGTAGQVLTTGGAAANPTWTTVTGTGTVTNVATNNGLTGGPITTTGTIGLATIATGNALAYTGAGSGVPVATAPTTLLDVIGSTTGNILYRAAGNWTVLAPGTNGQVLTQGATTPNWANAGSVSNVTIAGTSNDITVSGTCTITTTGTCTLDLAASRKTNPAGCAINVTAATTCADGSAGANNGTYTTPSGATWLEVEMIGGGGGGCGSGTTPGAGNAGGNTAFSTFTANGAAACSGASGGNGGAASGGYLNKAGGSGGFGSGAANTSGANGCNSPYGGGGVGGGSGNVGSAASVNTGSGGGGAGDTTTANTGGGGGCGGFVRAIISAPVATYSYAIGSGGAGGTAGTGGTAGGAGATGAITVIPHFNN